MILELEIDKTTEIKKEQVIISCLESIFYDQKDSGEIASYRSSFEDMSKPETKSNVFITPIILEILNRIKNNYSLADLIINKGIIFLLDNKEDKYTWRFFGKNSKIIPDYDDIAVILRLFEENIEGLNYRDFANEINSQLNNKGLFYTWFAEKGEVNNIDWVVNVNIYLYLKRHDFELISIEKYIEKIILHNEFREGSYYYHSFYYFFYLVSKGYKYFNSFQKCKPIIISEILLNIDYLNSTYLALAIVTLKNLGFKDKTILTNFENRLINNEQNYAMYSFFRHRTIEKFYGSYSFTNSIIIEALC